MTTATLRIGFLLLLSLLVSGIVGSSGCSCRTDEQVAAEKKKKEEEEKKKKKKGKAEKPKPPFEIKDVRTTPSDQVAGVARNAVKPGHWVATTTVMAANEANISGDLHSACISEDKTPLDIDHTNFYLRSNRPAALPKGQPRPFDSLVYVPRRFLPVNNDVVGGNQKRTTLEWRFTGPGGSYVLEPKTEPVTNMEEFQFFLIILSANPSSYSYFLSLDSISPPYSDENQSGLLPYYRIVAPRPGRAIPLPEATLAWTSIAVLVWDDIDPASLSVDQQQSLLDWLHWGGQLIISGPRTLDRLRGSFLAPYLPATAGDSIALENEHFAPLNDHWSLTPKDAAKMGKGMWQMSVLPNKPLLGVNLKLNPQGQYVPTCGEMVAEGWVGRGRIAITAFPLNDARLVNWRNLDHFINGALLRRPSREYKSARFEELQLTWKDHASMVQDPPLVSTLRYFTRDAGGSAETQQEFDKLAKGNAQAIIPRPTITLANDPEKLDWNCGGYWGSRESGVAGWNDFSSSADAARNTLQDAAKIKIPKADFVLKMVGVYLLILVPLNWLVFRSLGRVEWAWFAAPVIAVGGAGAVIRMAQLDIGFVRSRTDIAIVELQGNYDRAHVTRYTALYTSLASDYDLTFDDPHALCLPLARQRNYHRNPLSNSATQVTFRRDEKATMRGFQVQSSSTAWTHSEQMLPVGGLEWSGDEATGWKLKNNSPWNLKEIGVIRRSHSGDLEAAWIAELQPQAKVSVRFGETDSERIVPQWQNSLVMSPTVREEQQLRDDDEKLAGEVRLWRLVQIATKQLKLAKGEVRLVAWSDEQLPGLTIYPNSAQFTSRSLILAHLQRGPLDPPGRDVNTRVDVLKTTEPEENKPPRDLGKDDEPLNLKPQLPEQPETPDDTPSPDAP